MGFGRCLPFLALGILVLYQVGVLQAAPIRSAWENSSHAASLDEKEEDRLLVVLVKEIIKKMVSEKEQATENSRWSWILFPDSEQHDKEELLC